MSSFRKAAWDNPEKSIGDKIGTIKGKTVWEARGPAAQIFLTQLSGRIQDILRINKEDLEAGEDIAEQARFHIWMVGRKQESARPTIIFACNSSKYRKKCIQLMEESKILGDFPGMDLTGSKRMPQPKAMGLACNPLVDDLGCRQSELEEGIIYAPAGDSSVCGKLISVGSSYEATLGGGFLINGIQYGFTTIHSRTADNAEVDILVGEGGDFAFDDDSDTESTGEITTLSLQESEVWIAAGKSGLMKGTIIPNPHFIKMSGSETYQKMWPVKLDRNIVPGDCGSWVVNAQSGGLYGHIVAGDTSLQRAYIIPALDVVHDIHTKFGHETTMPVQSGSLPRLEGKTYRPSLSGSTVQNVPQSRTSQSKATSVDSSRISNHFFKKWDPNFSNSSVSESHSPWITKKTCQGGTDESYTVSFWESDELSCKLEEIEEFVQGARPDLASGAGEAGSRRAAWLDDRGSRHSLSKQDMREYDNPLTATELYQRLQIPRFDHEQRPDANRRLIHIQNLDANYVLSLAETVPLHQKSILKDAIWAHLALQTSLLVKVPLRGYPNFQIEMHIPYFTFREQTVSLTSDRKRDREKFPRAFIDLSYLSPDLQWYGLHEAHLSFVICGSSENRWTGYSFVDTHEDEEDMGSEPDLDHSFGDPIASNKLNSQLPIWDPREYFLRICEIRMGKVRQEWELIVRKLDLSVRHYQRSKSIALVRHTAENTTRDFLWNRQTSVLLNNLQDILSQTIKVWFMFNSSGGNFNYFLDLVEIEDSSNSLHARCRVSLLAIKQHAETLESLEY